METEYLPDKAGTTITRLGRILGRLAAATIVGSIIWAGLRGCQSPEPMELPVIPPAGTMGNTSAIPETFCVNIASEREIAALTMAVPSHFADI